MLTIEQKKEIYEEYQDRSKTLKEIAEKYGIGTTIVSHIAVDEMGAEPRLARSYNVKRKRPVEYKRICPECHRVVEVKGAKFCCFCGTDMRSKKELLIERIEGAMPNILHLPSSMRDGMQTLFIDIIKELKGADNEKI